MQVTGLIFVKVALTRPLACYCLQVKLCDFGLAKVLCNEMNENSKALVTPKTPTVARCTSYYTSPERHGDYKASKPDDVFAFGMTMFFMATGVQPLIDLPADAARAAIMRGERPNGLLQAWVMSSEGQDKKAAEQYAALAARCWDAIPARRPAFEEVWRKLSEIRAGLLNTASAGSSGG